MRRAADIPEASEYDTSALYSSMRIRTTDVTEAPNNITETDPGAVYASVKRQRDVTYGTVSIKTSSRKGKAAPLLDLRGGPSLRSLLCTASSDLPEPEAMKLMVVDDNLLSGGGIKPTEHFQ
ncbi:uncharacterized protein FYW61_019478 isoform 1-T1 [Anableps anableps]